MSLRGRFLLCLGLPALFLCLSALAATHRVASRLRHARPLGSRLTIGDLSIYPPFAVFTWRERFRQRAPATFTEADEILLAGAAVALLSFGLGYRLTRREEDATTHGSSRWARRSDLRNANLLPGRLGVSKGVVLAQTADATYKRVWTVKDGEDECGWALQKPGTLLRHSGPEHVLVFAPTRSGKGVGICIPTLLGWSRSVFVWDIKGELWRDTAGYRSTFSRCWRFEPSAIGSVRFNPLFEIRPGLHEIADTQLIAESLVDPDGGRERTHWVISAGDLLSGVILHVLYAEKDKSLHGLLRFLTDPSRTYKQTWERMLYTRHLGDTAHPHVASVARSMLNKPEEEAGSVASTALAALALYSDPIIAMNTSASDFAIADLMNLEIPVSLYVVAPELERLRPLVRLFLQLMIKRLTLKLGDYKHRLLLLLDEFPSLGKLSFFETALGFLAGYGIKCMPIIQDLDQAAAIYGDKNTIAAGCDIKVTYHANVPKTAQAIAQYLGQATITRKQRSRSGLGLFGAKNVSESDQELGRSLLTADEIQRLPYDEALVIKGGAPPYRAKKVMFYTDKRFTRLLASAPPPPTDPDKQRGELPKRRPCYWGTLPPIEPTLPIQPADAAKVSYNPEANTGGALDAYDDVIDGPDSAEASAPSTPPESAGEGDASGTATF